MSSQDSPEHYLTRKIKLFPKHKSSHSNKISTLKYTIFSFFPRALLFKLTAFPVPYFLFYFALLNIHEVTISEEPYFFLGLILLILLIHLIKEALYERVRYRWSKKVNRTPCEVYDPIKREFVMTKAAALRLGDVIKITQENSVPADVVLIYHDLHETCKISHDNLDGETSFKTKKTVNRVARVLKNSTMIGNNMPNVHLLEGITIKYEEPNPYYHNFNGDITFLGVRSSLDDSYFIPRAANMKSVGFALGIVVYVGKDSKLMQNIHRAKTKSPSIEKEAFGHLRFILIIHTCLAIFCAVYDTVWTAVNRHELDYIYPPGTEPPNFAEEFFVTVGRWLLLIVEIPTSLLIHLELMRAYQAHVLVNHPILRPDPNAPSDVIVNNDSVLEEIGRVQYLFLDKTYILTPNKWRIKEIVTGGQEFMFKPVRPARTSSNAIYQNLQFDKVVSSQDNQNYKYLTEAMCWSLVGLSIGKNVLSLADQAILDFANTNGFELKERLDNDNDKFLVSCPKEMKEITLLHTIEEEQGTNFLFKEDNLSEKIILFCIGTIDYLFPYIEKSADPKVKAKVESFSSERFKTIFFAYTTLEDEECNTLIEKYSSHPESQSQSQVQKYFKDMKLLCVAGVGESRHPDSQSIVEFMYKTGVNIWLLSGDNRESLINSAYLTRIFPHESPHIAFISNEFSHLKKEIEERHKDGNNYEQHYLLLAGTSLTQLEQDPNLLVKLVILATRCQGVIGYGVTPKQKQQLVKCLKKVEPRKVILALGKGPKDIPMMTEANVSIGVKESYSLNVADFIITKMYDIKVIMYVYGRETYRKNSVLFQYIIYRGMYISLATFFWGINSAFTGNPLFSHFLLTFFEMMFTSIPITVFCLYDRKRSDEELLNRPELYHNARNNRYFNHKTFYLWKINGGIQGFWIWLFLCFFALQSFTCSEGWTPSYWVIAHVAFWLNIIAVNCLLLVYASRINIALVVSVIAACALFIAFWNIESEEVESDSYGTLAMSARMPTLYIASLLVLVCSFIPIIAFQRYYKIMRRIRQGRQE